MVRGERDTRSVDAGWARTHVDGRQSEDRANELVIILAGYQKESGPVPLVAVRLDTHMHVEMQLDTHMHMRMHM